jgi:hypothetical protein
VFKLQQLQIPPPCNVYLVINKRVNSSRSLNLLVHYFRISFTSSDIDNVLYSRECSWPGYSLFTLATTVRKKQTPKDLIKNLLFTGRHLMGVPFITSPTSNLRTAPTTQNITERRLYYLTSKKHYRTSTKCIFNYNTSATVHKQGMFGLPQHKPLPRSTANSSLTICMFGYIQVI